MEIFVCVGESNARKSSVIRALTGANYATESSVRKNWDLEINGRLERTFVLTSAMQEAKVRPQTIIAQIRKSDATHAIIALRLRAAKGMGDHNTYLKEFHSAGWKVQVAWFGAAGNSNHVTSEIHLPNTIQDPTNVTAAKLRRRWKIS